MDWNTWPGSPSFGAMMQETDAPRPPPAGTARTCQPGVRRSYRKNVISPAARERCRCHRYIFPKVPNRKPQKIRTQVIEDLGVCFVSLIPDGSGIYKVTIGADPREYLFAVNVPMTRPDQGGSESDLTRLDKTQLQTVFPDWEFQLVNDPRQANYAVASGPAASDDISVEPERGARGSHLGATSPLSSPCS